MLFQYTWRFVLSGEKTQTRRLVQPGDRATFEENDPSRLITQVIRTSDAGVPKLLYKVGKTYSVQPGIAKKTVGNIRLKAIRKERLQDISEADAMQEIPVKSPQPDLTDGQWAMKAFKETWELMYKTAGSQWQDNPEVWILEFEPAIPGAATSTKASPFGNRRDKGQPTDKTSLPGKGILAQLANPEPDDNP
jgi:hypothetical protein